MADSGNLPNLAAANVALAQGRYADGEAFARAALALNAASHEALHALSAALWGQGGREESLALMQMAIDELPAAPRYWYDYAWGLEKLGRFDAAFDAYAHCLQLEPAHAEARNAYALLVRMTGRFEEALAFYNRMLERGVTIRAVHLHRAIALAKLGRLEESLPQFRRSIAEEGPFQSTRWEFSGPLLALKQFEEGWRNYEHRFDAPDILYMDCARFPGVPRWKGESLKGKSILVHREQGLGDQVMFASMIPDLIQRGAKVQIDVAEPLRELLLRSFPQAKHGVIPGTPGAGSSKGRFDYEAPIGSLAAVLRNDQAAFPAAPYLSVSDKTRKAWRARLKTAGLMEPGVFRVGVVWTVNANPGYYGASKRVLEKQMQLSSLAPLAMQQAGITTALVSLSNNAAPVADFAIHDFSSLLTDLHETAALAELMDLVVTVDTSVAHVASALGKETWILLPHQADWRWGTDDSTSYWYANAHLFRQPAPGRWDAVMNTVSARLTTRLQERVIESNDYRKN